MVVFTVLIFVSQLVFAYLMAMITACLTNADATRARFSEKLTLAKRYMEHERLEHSLRSRVVAYYNYLWQRTKGAEPQQLFSSLPRSIWGSVSYCLYGDLIRSPGVFHNYTKLTPHSTLPTFHLLFPRLPFPPPTLSLPPVPRQTQLLHQVVVGRSYTPRRQ